MKNFFLTIALVWFAIPASSYASNLIFKVESENNYESFFDGRSQAAKNELWKIVRDGIVNDYHGRFQAVRLIDSSYSTSNLRIQGQEGPSMFSTFVYESRGAHGAQLFQVQCTMGTKIRWGSGEIPRGVEPSGKYNSIIFGAEVFGEVRECSWPDSVKLQPGKVFPERTERVDINTRQDQYRDTSGAQGAVQ